MKRCQKESRSSRYNLGVITLVALILFYISKETYELYRDNFLYFEFIFEIIIAFICLNIFLLMIHTYRYTNKLTDLLLGVSFLVAGVLNFIHGILVINYNHYFFVDVVIPIGVDLIIAVSFYIIWFIGKTNRYKLVIVNGLVSLVIIYLFLGFWIDSPNFILGVEGIITILISLTIIIYQRKIREDESRVTTFASNGLTFFLLSSLLFASKRVVSYSFPILIIDAVAHLYKVTTFIYIFKAFFVEEVTDGIIAKKELEIERVKVESQTERIKDLRVQRHDFKNELQTIYTMLQLNKNKEAQDYIPNLHFDLDNITSDREEHNFLDTVLLPKKKKAEKNKIDFNVEVNTQIKNTIIPKNKVLKILFNLVDNAIDAVCNLSEARRKITVRLERSKNNIKLIVHNNGPIISDEVIDDIFNPGFSTKQGDRGFGLYIIKSLLDDFNGRIMVKSKEGLGTNFICLLPKKKK
ncbi:ATP-binding protein [Natroniella sulfidigena]|uniref:sensor histidine kinase n=1 Tax=Natroniella sulfidigena TaxID=723921 RepID=UPI00200A3BEC|nr:ATP-binding protein [Natroniella sulfidigena]MCK8816441.1 ATP-binding protein [Natroniella sulfidigena]